MFFQGGPSGIIERIEITVPRKYRTLDERSFGHKVIRLVFHPLIRNITTRARALGPRP